MSAVIQECLTCQARLFPERLFCPECGGDGFLWVRVDEGTVEVATSLADGTLLATLRLDGGARVIGRLTASGVEPGVAVPLTNSKDAGPGVHAYIPITNDAVNEDQQ
ncbi:zinc ribbon domain-containing protein [Paenarthrobacter sp. S56]|uniref:zinc ribbon domain-containing protein n=1 Tax=Paenarthrobacter sp. S56 TaxID=3138179 RepID=UPI00321AB624